LAQYLGFKWRDETPSGALSIQWFNEYIETKDPKKLERILLYNEDDCKATMVLKDGIKKLSDSIK
jgi:predicted RecB family nuclease